MGVCSVNTQFKRLSQVDVDHMYYIYYFSIFYSYVREIYVLTTWENIFYSGGNLHLNIYSGSVHSQISFTGSRLLISWTVSKIWSRLSNNTFVYLFCYFISTATADLLRHLITSSRQR